jgi:hypothetical protein
MIFGGMAQNHNGCCEGLEAAGAYDICTLASRTSPHLGAGRRQAFCNQKQGKISTSHKPAGGATGSGEME